MARRRPQICKVDANHVQIIEALRKFGIRAMSTAKVGSGFPDIAASLRGVNVLLEVKDGNASLNEAEKSFHQMWNGPVFVVTTPEEAIRAVVEAARPAQSVEAPNP
jgi:hypothetical protein